MDVEINLWGVLLAIVASFAVGFVWYMPGVFGEKWRILIKMDKKTMQKGPDSSAWFKTLLGAGLQAYVLAHVSYLSYVFFSGADYFESTLTTAAWMWLGFQLSAFLTHDSFEQRPLQLTAINAGNQLLTLFAMALVLGWVGL